MNFGPKNDPIRERPESMSAWQRVGGVRRFPKILWHFVTGGWVGPRNLWRHKVPEIFWMCLEWNLLARNFAFCDFSLTLWFLKMERAPSSEEKRNQHNEFMRIFLCVFFYCDKIFLSQWHKGGWVLENFAHFVTGGGWSLKNVNVTRTYFLDVPL